MRRLDLKKNQELIELLKYGTGLKVNHVPNEAHIEEIFYNEQGNYFINAMVPVMERKIIKKTSQEVDSEMNCEIIESVTWQQASVLAYFSEEDNRVEKAVTLPRVTFIPVNGSNMFGILVSEDTCMMTCNIGQNINNNSPLEFKIINGLEVAILTYEIPGGYFSTLVDKKGNIVGPVYNSITNDYKDTNTCAFKMSDFELGFGMMAQNEREFIKAESENQKAELLGKLYTLS